LRLWGIIVRRMFQRHAAVRGLPSSASSASLVASLFAHFIEVACDCCLAPNTRGPNYLPAIAFTDSLMLSHNALSRICCQMA